MGCVYSRDERTRPRHVQSHAVTNRGKPQVGQTASRPASKKGPRPVQVKNAILKREAQPAIQVEVKRSESTSPTRDSGVDVASNSALNQTTTAVSASLEAGNDLPFRRQHFDRNSVLRHSKKRRKSSSAGSTTNSPVKSAVTSPEDKSTEATQPRPVRSWKPIQTSPVKTLNTSVVVVDHCVSELQKESLDTPVVEAITEAVTIASNQPRTIGSSPAKETFSASANVAALLGKPQQSPHPQPQQPTVPQDVQQPKTTFEAIRSTNGLQQRPPQQNKDKRPHTIDLKPNKSRRSSAPSVHQEESPVNQLNRKWSQQPTSQQTAEFEAEQSSQKLSQQTNGHSNGGRRALRTRREAAEATNGLNGVHTESTKGDEDCGRLI